jgi:hypothetical protein
MRKILIVLLFVAGLFSNALSQSDGSKTYRNFPIVITLQFHSLSMPFQRMLSNFRNPGIGIGTEISLNGDHNWAQQITAMWYRNSAVGNGILFYTQVSWRPSFDSDVYGEIKAGLGYEYSFRPTSSYKIENGKWINAGHRGKGMLAIPVGLSLGYNHYSTGTYASPFVSYQFLLLKGYSASVPIVPQTLIQFGSRVHTN